MGTADQKLSPNFGFLAEHERNLVLLAARAERLFTVDPVSSIAKVRLFAELLAQETAARVGIYDAREENQNDRLNRLCASGAIVGDVDRSFHWTRRAGNAAVHDNQGDHMQALQALRLGDPLVPHQERVARALKKITTSRPWTDPQRKWLERIGRQLEVEVIVDRDALDRGVSRPREGLRG